jgi:Pyruvate/2-oxoacid:ferredoxin oxidoreductase gamma subunit
MATTVTLPISDEDVDELESLLRDLKTRAAEANDKGNVIMLGMYAELVKLVSPEVQRLRARLDREEKAAINKQHKAMRQARRNGAGSAA